MNRTVRAGRRKWTRYIFFFAVYAVLFVVTSAIILSYEDKCPSGLDILTCSEALPAAGIALYFAGVYVLRFPIGTVLGLFDNEFLNALAIFSFVPNSILICYFVTILTSRFRRTP